MYAAIRFCIKDYNTLYATKFARRGFTHARFQHTNFTNIIIRQSMCALLWPIVHQSAFSAAVFKDMSDIHECLVCIQLSLLAVKFTQHVFSPLLCGSPPPLTNHPYAITCGTGEKLSKMAGNSAR